MNDLTGSDFIAKKKIELFDLLQELEKEKEVLSKNIARARKDLEKVQTMDDAKKFDEYHDLEKGLNHIQLF